MQLITLTIAALSIGTHVLAAPTHARRSLLCVDSDLTCLTKKSLPVVEELLDPVISTETIVEPLLNTVPSVPVVESLVTRQFEKLPTDDLTTTVDPLTAPVVDIVEGIGGTVESVVPIATELVGRELDSLTEPLSPLIGSTVGTVASTLNTVPVAGPALTELAASVVAAVEPVTDTVEETLESVPVVGETVDNILRRSIPSVIDNDFIKSTVASVEETIASVPVIDSVPAVGSLEPATLSKVNNGAGSLVASHVSPVIKRSTISTVSSAISELVSTVTVDLNVISTTVDTLSALSVPGLADSPVSALSVTPTVTKALDNIASTLDATVAEVLPVLTTTVEPLVDTELASLGDVLGDVNDLLANIETVVLSLLNSVTDEVKLLLANEIQEVLTAITPLVAPITSFAFTMTGDASSTPVQITEVRSAASKVFVTVSSLINPAGSVLSVL